MKLEHHNLALVRAVENGDRRSLDQAGSKINHAGEFWVWLRDLASMNEVEE